MDTTGLALTSRERSFLETSLEERVARQETESARTRHEKNLERRSRNFLRALVGVFAVATLAATLLSIFAFGQRDFALKQQKIAEEQATLAISRELVNSSILNLEVDPELSILLALQAINMTRTQQVENILHRAVEASPIRQTIPETGWNIAFSPDGTRLAAAGGSEPTVRIWDAETGMLIRSLEGHSGRVTGVMFSPDGRLIASSGTDQTARLWDAATGEELYQLTSHTDLVLSIAFSPDGEYLATTSADGTAKIWEAGSGKEISTFEGNNSHNNWILSAAFSPTGLFATSSPDDTVVWELKTGQEILRLEKAFYLEFSPDGRFLAGKDLGIVQVWDVSDPDSPKYGQVIQTFSSADSDIGTSFVYSPDGDFLLTISVDHTEVIVWNAENGRENYRFACSPGGYEIAFRPGGEQIAVTGANGINFCNLSPGQEWLTFSDYRDRVYNVSFSPDGTRLYTAARNDGLKIWNLEDISSETYGQLILHMDAQGDGISDAVPSPDGTLLAISRESGMVQIYDSKTWEEIMAFQGHTDWVWDLAFSPDGKKVTSGSFDQTAIIWDLETGEKLVSLSGHETSINAVAFSPDGSYVVTAGNDNLRIWNAVTGEELISLGSNSSRGASFNPEGSILAVDQGIPTIRLWDFQSLISSNTFTESFHLLTGVSNPINITAFNPDGDLLATGDVNGWVKVYNLSNYKEEFSLNSHSANVGDVEFSPDGKLLASASWDGTVRLHLVELDDLIELALERLTRWFKPEECVEYLHTETCPPAPWDGQPSSQP